MSPNQKLIVEVIEARNLLPRDGEGSVSPYVVVDFYGQRRRTRTIVRDLNPVWNEALEFSLAKRPMHAFADLLELYVYHDRNFGQNKKQHFMGRLRLGSNQFVRKGEEALIYYNLEKKSLFSFIQGDIGLKIYYSDETPVIEPIPEIKREEEKTSPSTTKENEAKTTGTEAIKVDEESKKEAEVSSEQKTGGEPVEGEPAETGNEVQHDADERNSGEEKVEPLAAMPPADSQSDDVVIESRNVSSCVPPASPVPEVTISRSVSGSTPLSGGEAINFPQPIRRAASETASYISEISDVSTTEKTSFDLVEKMHYVFVRIVKAKYLPTNGCPVVKVSLSSKHITSKPARKTIYFEWDQTFAFLRESPDDSSILEISVWDPLPAFIGGIYFDVAEIPLRDPPDSPLAPQWYKLEGSGAHGGDMMLAAWTGTQADEAFPEAWKTDTAGHVNSRAKVYVSPKLWYLRATVIEAQDVLSPPMALKDSSFLIRAQLGFQVQRTKPAVTRNGVPTWNEDLLFVAAEPFSDQLVFTMEHRQPKGFVSIGIARVPLTTVERRVDDRNVTSRWLSFEAEEGKYKCRAHLKLYFDGGYHVMDEAAHVCSDYRPTARQLWKPPLGTIELGIIGCKNLLPMKSIAGKSSTDAYTVAKYGPKWIRTRTVSDSLDPKWNEQYTWKVYDPSTVLTVGVFDSWGEDSPVAGKELNRPDIRIGKVRIRISTLETGIAYRNTYPLQVLGNGGLKRMGEIELAVRFIRTSSSLDVLHAYSQPLLPIMHHIKPLGVAQQEILRNSAVKILAVQLSRSEPPLRAEIVKYMLDADSHSFSMRKVRANWFRIINVIAGLNGVVRWVDNTRVWKKPTATLLFHVLLVMLIWFPDLIVPTLAFYVFVIGAWNYRFRARDPLPHFDPKLSLAEIPDHEELDEEFDTMPSSRTPETVKMRYDKLRAIGTRVQNVLGDLATQGERVQALVTWRDPRATGIFVGLCFVVAMVLYLVPSKMVAMASAFYYFRHPIFRDRKPSPALNFFRRLPSLSDRIM